MSVLVYTESWNGIFRKSTFEAVSYAKTIANMLETNLTAISLGMINNKELEELSNYGVNKVRFTNMVPVDSKIRARATVSRVRQRSGATQVIGETTVEIQGQEKPACVAETVSFYYFK